MKRGARVRHKVQVPVSALAIQLWLQHCVQSLLMILEEVK